MFKLWNEGIGGTEFKNPLYPYPHPLTTRLT